MSPEKRPKLNNWQETFLVDDRLLEKIVWMYKTYTQKDTRFFPRFFSLDLIKQFIVKNTNGAVDKIMHEIICATLWHHI